MSDKKELDRIKNKRCTKCLIEKNGNEFYTRLKRGKYCLESRCIVCIRTISNAKNNSPDRKKYIEEYRNRPETKARKLAHQQSPAQRSKQREYCRLESTKAREREYRKKTGYHRGAKLKKQYWPNLHWKNALKAYDAILKLQNNKCATCLSDQSEFKKSFAVDHCHSSNKIRGLLCEHCNLALGHVKDRIEILKNLISYLEQSNAS